MKEWFVLLFFGGTLLSQALCQDEEAESDSSSRCGQYWFENPMTGLCYRLTDDTLTFNQAKAKCRSFRGKTDLCSINSAQEQYFISSLLANKNSRVTWIGFYTNRRGRSSWMDGSLVTYTNWAPRNPKRNTCAYVGNYFRWYSYNCNVRLQGCCKKVIADLNDEAFSLDQEDTWHYFPETEKYYKTVSLNKTWDEARAYCKNLATADDEKTDLVSIHSVDEQDFLDDLIDTINMWWIGLYGTIQKGPRNGGPNYRGSFSGSSGYAPVIGGSEYRTSGYGGSEYGGYTPTQVPDEITWKWSDGSLVDFTNWQPNVKPPTEPGTYHVYFSKGSYWEIASSDDQMYFVCEKVNE